jgi:hypothetical protein
MKTKKAQPMFPAVQVLSAPRHGAHTTAARTGHADVTRLFVCACSCLTTPRDLRSECCAT